MWFIIVFDHAEKQLAKLPKKQRQIVGDAIHRMKKDPFQGDVRALQAGWKGYFRKVAGTHRIIFSVDRSTHAVSIKLVLKRTKSTYR